MRFPTRLSRRPFTPFTLSSYDDTARAVRSVLGVKRLTKEQAAEVRAAVERHNARANRRHVSAACQPIQKLREQLRIEVAAEVSREMDNLFRMARSSWAGGETTDYVTISPVRSASGDTVRAWSSNGKWSGSNVVRHVNVTPAWRTKIRNQGIATLDGMLTTHATPIETVDGIELFDAFWVRQGRGYSLESEAGVIAFHRASGTAYHAAGTHDTKVALRGIRRKMKSQGIPQEVREARRAERKQKERERHQAELADLVERVKSHDLGEVGEVVVTLLDSYSAGNCEPGTLQFRDRYFPGKDRATISEIAGRLNWLDLSNLSGSDLMLARQVAAACLVAIRRNRNLSRSLSNA